MRLFNLAKAFEEKPTCEDILKKVTKIEIMYWVFLVFFVFLTLIGFAIINGAAQSDLKQHIIGLFLAIIGIVNVALIKIWAHIKVSMLYTMWDSQNRLKVELDRLESADL